MATLSACMRALIIEMIAIVEMYRMPRPYQLSKVIEALEASDRQQLPLQLAVRELSTSKQTIARKQQHHNNEIERAKSVLDMGGHIILGQW